MEPTEVKRKIGTPGRIGRISLSPKQKVELFLSLKEASFYEVGRNFGLDKYYTTIVNLRSAVYRVYKDVVSNWQTYGVNENDLNEIVAIVKSRTKSNLTFKGGKAVMSLAEKPKADGGVVTVTEQRLLAAQTKPDIKEMALSTRDKSLLLLNKRMDMLFKSRKALAEIPLGTLAQVYGITFDKAQIVQGQATENIAMLAKIDKNISPEDAMKAILNIRENNQIAKAKK